MKQSEWLGGHNNLLVGVYKCAACDLGGDTLQSVDALGFVLRAAEWFALLGVDIDRASLLEKAVRDGYSEKFTKSYIRT